MPPIALITDLGNKDYFIAAMKGVILSINPDAKIVDITHQIPKQDIQTASLVLANSAQTFPKNSVFIAVIDPGVGTERKCILLRTKNNLNFIGPDNGVFTGIADRFGVKEIREITNKNIMREKISSTFHGRDIMAPAAAHLSLGLKPHKIGSGVEGLKRLVMEKPGFDDDGLYGRIINIDDFGNLVTNLEEGLVKKLGEMGSNFKISIGENEFEVPFVKAFDDVEEGENLCLIGSTNNLEIAKNRGNLASEIDVKKNDKVNITIDS